MTPFQTNPSWTPAAYRRALEVWRANAPLQDSEIMPKPRRTAKPRHSNLARQLRAIVQYRDPPGVDDLLQTTWRTMPSNDNDRPDDYYVERIREVTPSPEEMLIRMKEVQFLTRSEPAMLATGRHAAARAHREIHAYPVGGDIEKETIKRRLRNWTGIVRLGRLLFSNGEMTETGYFLGPDDKVITGRITIPAGGLMNAVDKPAASKGSLFGKNMAASNKWFAETLKSEPFRFIKPCGKKRRRAEIPNPPLPPISMSFDEAREFAGLEPIMISRRAALPCGSPSVADAFPGMRKKPASNSGSQSWEDAAHGVAAREAWYEMIRETPAIDIDMLETAMKAQSFEEIGIAAGHSGPYAVRAGKRILLAVNDNLERAARKIAA